MILVTGATGFIGHHLVEELRSRGQPVRVLTRDPAAVGERWGGGVEIVPGDLLVPPTLEAAVRGARTVVHLAAALPQSGAAPGRFHDVNVDGTRHLAAAAAGAGVRRFILGSSAGVYGDGTDAAPRPEGAPLEAASPYDRSKLNAERAAATGLGGEPARLVVLRIAGVYGPGRSSTLEFHRRVLHSNVWIHGPSVVIVHPTYVRDVVQALLLAIECDQAAGLTVNIAGERPLAYPALIDLTGRLLGRRIRQVVPPAWIASIAARARHSLWPRGAAPAWVARISTPLVNRSLDIDRACRVLGFSPAPLEDSIRETIAWFRRAGQL